MKPIVRLGAVGQSPWIPVDWLKNTFSIGLVGIPSSNATLTWGVQHTFDDPGPEGALPVSFSQTTTTITVTDLRQVSSIAGHGASVADSVVLTSTQAGVDGTYAVATVTSQSVYTLTSTVSQSASGANARANILRPFNHATMTGQTGRLDGNYAFPIRALRLIVTAYTAGYVDLITLEGYSR
jgi:hypothetical protein